MSTQNKTSKKFTYSEIFKSLEGEGPHSGKPTVYIRFSRCNFTCGKFNNPDFIVDDKGYAPLNFDPKDVQSLKDFDPIEMGCDSQYAVNPKFKHIWKTGDENHVAEEVMKLVPHNQWKHPVTGLRSMLSLTGGEPTLIWKTLPTLLNHPSFDELETILIETNCAVKFKEQFIDELKDWVHKRTSSEMHRKIIWSNSPKLSASGEEWNKAIVPEVAMMQRRLTLDTWWGEDSSHFEQYFKFVCGPNKEDFDEVEKAMEEYYNAGIPRSVGVFIMPMSCTEEQQNNISANVADMCIDRGYIYCHRIHNSVYDNAIGK